jgi:hypothetical protein
MGYTTEVVVDEYKPPNFTKSLLFLITGDSYVYKLYLLSETRFVVSAELLANQSFLLLEVAVSSPPLAPSPPGLSPARG